MSEVECVWITQHVVRRPEVEPRPEPGSNRWRDVDPGLHRPLALETRVATEDVVAIVGGGESKRRIGPVTTQVAHGGNIPAHRGRLERTEHETAAVAPAAGATLHQSRRVIESQRGLEERRAVIVTVGV